MKRAKILLLTQILILASVFAPIVLTNRANASASGKVCIASAGTTSCPTIPPVLSPGLNSTQLRVAIVISNSTAINGFDITIRTNRTVLRPTAVDFSQTILAPPASIVVECLDGALVTGPTCLSTDVLGTIHLSLSGAAGVLSTASTGLLFTAIYNITGTTSTTPLAFQTGCSGTSVSGGACVTVTNGGSVAVPESVQVASFSNIPGLPSFTLDANPTTLSIVQGHFGASEIIATSFNNFTGLISLNTTVVPSGPSVTLGISSLLLPPNGMNTTALDVNLGVTVATGNYDVTVFARSGALTALTVVRVTVTGTTPPPDFQFSANPPSISFGQGTSGNTTLILTSIGGFSGTIMIGFTNITGNTIGLQEKWITNIVLPSGGISTSILLVTAAFNTPAGFVNLTLTATSGSTSHPVTVHLQITPLPAFEMKQPIITTVLVPQGFSNMTVIQVSTNSLFNGTIDLTTTSFPTGLSLILNTTSLTMGPNQVTTVRLILLAANTTLPGLYFVNVIGTSGNMTQSAYMNVIVVGVTPPPSPDFTLTVIPSFTSLPAGANASYTIFLTSLNEFSGIINLTATVFPSISNSTFTRLIPSSVILPANGNRTATLLVTTSVSTPGLFYTISVSGFGEGKVHFFSVSLQVLAPPDEPPVANFTFRPSNPVVGQFINFDGSGSVDPDGTVVSWTWFFGDGFISFGQFTSHSYNNPGNYTVTLTVQDTAGLSASKTTTIPVGPRPAHDVGIIEVFAQPTKVVSTQTVGIQVELTNTGSSNETVSVTGYANGRPIQTLKGIFLQACGPNPFCFSTFYVQLLWDTNGIAPGNYTISASVSLPPGETDPSPADNNATDGTVTVLPSPVITLSPNTGVDGTKVLVQGTGFPVQQQFGFQPISLVYVNFDNMSAGFTFAHNGTFTFIFDVPLSQPGGHLVFAFDPYSGAHASAPFTVQATPTGSLAVSVDIGPVYFPGDTAVAGILTTFNGSPVGPQNVQLQVILLKPDGTNVTLTANPIGNGFYKATYAIPSTGAVLGTYFVLAKAHQQGPIDATALVSFEVKLTWTNANGGKITIGATAVAGVIGLVAVAWKKGYLRRKDNEEPGTSFPF